MLNSILESRKIEPILKLRIIKKGLVSGLDIMLLLTAAIRLNLNIRDRKMTIKIPTPKVGKTEKKAPIEAPNAISFTLPLALDIRKIAYFIFLKMLHFFLVIVFMLAFFEYF